MSLQSPLAKVRGLGSAKEGSHHWWAQRITAIALTPLMIWFVYSWLCMIGADYDTVVNWLQSPLSAALMLITIVAFFYHAQLGIQVVVEDYIHTEWLKISLLLAVNFTLVLLGLLAAIAVLRISLGAQ